MNGVRATARAKVDALIAARDTATLLPTFTGADPTFSLADAYEVADAIRRARIAAGDTPRGYKIGFTNRGIWDRYGVHEPIWGPIWNSTLEFAGSGGRASISLGAFSQPRLEPEIVFSFERPPRPGMSESELAGCIDWVAHGFEIVHTHFEGWRFQAADTVADFALHGRLFVGTRVALSEFGEASDAAAELARIEVTLCRDGADVETGQASIVLGGPLTALRLWVDAMSAQPQRWPIERGDIVTTGTITDAAPLKPGERWHTRLSDGRLKGVVLETVA